MRSLAAIFALWIGIVIGISLPDLDQHIWLLSHRSILTHGWLLPFLVCALLWGSSPSVRLFAIGFSGAVAIHLCFDLFPQHWAGFALITVPLVGRTSPLFSWLWIAGSCVLCLYLACALMRRLQDLLLSSASLGVSVLLYARTESSLWWGVVAFIGASGLACICAVQSLPFWRSSDVRRAP
jgi:hypothetical protein